MRACSIEQRGSQWFVLNSPDGELTLGTPEPPKAAPHPMDIWRKLFGAKQPAEPRHTEPLEWEQLPTISAIALLDADAFSRAPAILHGMLGLRDVLIDAAKTAFPTARQTTLAELIAMKCQFLVSVDTSAGLVIVDANITKEHWREKVQYDILDLGQVLGQRAKR